MASALVVGALLFAGCDLGSGDDGPAAAATPAKGEAMNLDVLVYNVEYGGEPETDKVIRSLDADVVGVLESYERLPEIAERTGYPYYNTSLQLLSKYPILEPSGGDGLYALIEVEPGYVVPFFNDHLDYVAWGPRGLRNGDSVAVRDREREPGAHIGAGAADRGDGRADRRRLPDLPHRRLQRALEPRLHRGRGRQPRGDRPSRCRGR